jgi:AcrR family transcriptional regulator
MDFCAKRGRRCIPESRTGAPNAYHESLFCYPNLDNVQIKKYTPPVHKNSYHHGDLKNALIQAAIEIVAAEGVYGLTLRKAARRAGVSHNAPYAHFADKQSLIAAIALEGHVKIHALIENVAHTYPDAPLKQFVNLAWAYVKFGLECPAHYKITFSGLIENEKNYPAFVEVSQHSLQLLQRIVADCQAAGMLSSLDQPVDLMAVSAWSLIHGLVSLIIEGQVPSKVLEQNSPRAMVISALQQIVRAPIDASMLETA